MQPEPLRVVVVEDEPLNRQRMVRLLQQAACQVVAEFEEGDALLAWLDQGIPLDAIFLDIQMPGASGLELLERLPAPVPVVFVTAHSEHAVDAYDTAAVDYLLKPVRPERLARSLARIREQRLRLADSQATARKPWKRFPVKAGGGLVLLDLGKTTHFEVVDEVVWAHTPGQSFQTIWTSLAAVEAKFPQEPLLRIHRHLLVRQEAVLGVRTSRGGRLIVMMAGGQELESSRPAAPRIRACLGLAGE
jgi:two-component system LytT family response regulator/two-component system response regulator AlgR